MPDDSPSAATVPLAPAGLAPPLPPASPTLQSKDALPGPAALCPRSPVGADARQNDAKCLGVETAEDKRTNAELSILSEQEKLILDALISSRRNNNEYGDGAGNGFSYMTNVIWQFRNEFQKKGVAATKEDVVSYQKKFGKRYVYPVKSEYIFHRHSSVRQLTSPPPREWYALYWGGILPYLQGALPRIRAEAFRDIVVSGDGKLTCAADRHYKANLHGDPAKDEVADRKRLDVILKAVALLGWEYAQSNPETSKGKEFNRRETIDCSHFLQRVFSSVDPSLPFLKDANQVSDYYKATVIHPDRIKVVKGRKWNRKGTDLVKGWPKVMDPPEEIALTDENQILAGDLGIHGVNINPTKGPDEVLKSDFEHIVIFTGRIVENQSEYIDASQSGEAVDFRKEKHTHPSRGYPLILRMKF